MSPEKEFDFTKYLELVKKHKLLFIVVSLMIMTGAVAISYLLPNKYEAKSTVFIEKNVISDLVKGIAVTPSMEETVKVLNFALTSRSLLAKVIDELDLNTKNKSDETREQMLAEIQKSIDIKVKEKNLFFISYKNKDARIARDFVNTLVRRYIEENVSSKREESYGATNFLSEQIVGFREKLEKAETLVNNYKRDKGGVISIDEGKLFQEINIAQQKLYDLQLRRRHLEGLRPVTRKAVDPMQNQLYALQKRLDELRVEYTENYPEVIKVRTDIETLRKQIKEASQEQPAIVDNQELGKAEAEIAALKVSEEGLKRYITANQALLRTIPSAKAGLEKLELEKNNQKNLYDQLVARHGQSEVSKQMEVQDKTTTFRVVDPAILPIKPVSPNRVKIIVLGILAGLAGGMGVLLLMDQLDKSVKNLDGLKSLGIPVLAVIPKMQNPQELVAMRTRDRRLYLISGAYLTIILAVLAIETGKSLSIGMFSLKQNVMELKNKVIK
jgi:polysaccharide chain length determinant protein (PEP-CTERM system associated)